MTAACHDEAPAAPAQAGALTVLLVGRPNSGKSSLWNAITGGDARVGNFPGITVEALEATVPIGDGRAARIVDLPGTYSLEAAVDPDSDEGIARRYIERCRDSGAPLLLAQVLDSTNLELGLRLTAELARLGLPLVLLVSQRDALEAEGRAVDVAALEAATGAPALWLSARSKATRGLMLQALRGFASSGLPAPPPARALDPRRVAGAAVTEVAAGDERPEGLALHRRTAALDRVLMHGALGPLAFLVAMAALFVMVFLVAEPASQVVEGGVDLLARGVRGVAGDGLLSSFLVDGVLAGAGTVVIFFPQIVLLTVALELIEASGYLARGAYLLDRLLRVVGLGGRSFVPLLMGHACAVPAIAATRAIREPGQRLTTMLVVPLMTCSARIPTFALLIATFFPGLSVVGRALLFLGLYAFGLFTGAVASLVIGRTAMRGRRSLPLVMELPPYRLPQPLAIARAGWRSGLRFLREVGTVIVVVSAVLWALLSVPVFSAPSDREVTGAAAPGAAATSREASVVQRSLGARLGAALEPLTAPVGFDWRINVGLIGSFGAREVMVSTMGVIFGVEDPEGQGIADLEEKIRQARRPDGTAAYTAATGLALLAFFVIACQCMSTIAALRRETHGWRWPLFVVGYTYVGAYAAAFLVYRGALLLGLG